MITKITPETTVKELVEIIEYMEDMEEKFIWLELYGDSDGTFCYYENGENETLVGIEDLEDYLDEPDKRFKLKCEIQDILREEEGLKKLLTIIREII